MAGRNFFLTQRQIRSILDAYSCRNGEFVDFGKNEDYSRISYKSRVLKGFVIVIERGNFGDIHVCLSSLGGRRTVTDVWKLSVSGVPEFLYRCNYKTVMDSVVLDDYKKEIELLKKLIANSGSINDTAVAEKGKRRGRPELDESVKLGIKELLDSGVSIRKTAEKFHVSVSSVQKYKKGEQDAVFRNCQVMEREKP